MLIAATGVPAAVSGVSALAAGAPPPSSTNGHKPQLVAAGLKTPTSFAFGDGRIFEGDAGNSKGSAPPNGGVYVLKSGAAKAIPGSPGFVAGLAWHDRALYVSGGKLTPSGARWQIDKWTGWNGKRFTHQKAIYTAPKGFEGFNGLGFGANGRLYVGVDVGLLNSNDHGAASKSPYLYDILSMRSGGKDLKIFASGIRQPWQFAFPAKSSSPYVTDLGQDTGAKNPPDFILRVKASQNYGFPDCNHTPASVCTTSAKPFQRFAPHTDLMGIAIHSKWLYVSSFDGRGGKGAEVYSLPLKGGALKPLLKGFVAPIVGLGIHGNYLYVGELTGEVFRVRI